MNTPPRILMVLTSHRLDCLKLCLDLLAEGGSIYRFDRVVLLLNGVVGRHKRWIDDFVASHPEVKWDFIAGPRGKDALISNLQNKCVKRYPDSLYFKIDEDTFVSADWDLQMLEAYEKYGADERLSLITPVIPNNGTGYHYLLNRYTEIEKAYHEQFSEPITSECHGAVWLYPQIGAWMTRQFLNMEDSNKRLREDNEEPFITFTRRFSINCLLYDYRHWKEIGGVPTKDEVGWGDWITAENKLVVLVTKSLVHHYSFFVQQDWLDRSHLLEELREENVPGTITRGSLTGWHLPRWQRIFGQLPRVLKRKLARKQEG